MNKNILFVVEGERDEPRFLNSLVRALHSDAEYEIFTYGTNLHKLLDGMFECGDIDEDLDFLGYLKSISDGIDREMLDRRFSDIYLLFDMDPQDPKYDPDKVAKATDYFDDSTDNGKLYINYPMLESYRHVRSLDDLSYLDCLVNTDDIKSYKRIVNEEGIPVLSQLSKMNKDIWVRLIELNLRKTDLILGFGKEVPDYDTYITEFIQRNILERQLDVMDTENYLYVLNTSLFMMVDYNPGEFLRMIAGDTGSVLEQHGS